MIPSRGSQIIGSKPVTPIGTAMKTEAVLISSENAHNKEK
jgi:hypothetical protein